MSLCAWRMQFSGATEMDHLMPCHWRLNSSLILNKVLQGILHFIVRSTYRDACQSNDDPRVAIIRNLATKCNNWKFAIDFLTVYNIQNTNFIKLHDGVNIEYRSLVKPYRKSAYFFFLPFFVTLIGAVCLLLFGSSGLLFSLRFASSSSINSWWF